MNTLQRPLFDAPMPMVEGSGITSMAMDEAAGEQVGAELTAAIAQGVADTENAIDAADDNVGIMNALRGKQASEEEYRTELAGYVGRKDANATPDSVLALVQPTMAMIELGDAPMGGIADMMPPQTFGVEEEVFGKLPVQKLQEGGLAGRIAEIQQLQKQFLPSEEDIRKAYAVQQPTLGQNLLAVGAPFVQGLLAPSERGGGINAALAAASQAASRQLAAQRQAEEQARQQQQRALLSQQVTFGKSALDTALAEEAKKTEFEAQQRLQELKNKGKGLDPSSKVGKIIADMRNETDPKILRIYEAQLKDAAITFEDKQAILFANVTDKLSQQFQNTLNAQIMAGQEKTASTAYDTLIEETESRAGQAQQVTGLLTSARELAKQGGTGVTGNFLARAQEAVLTVGKLAPELAPIANKLYKQFFQQEFKEGEVLDQRSARFGLQAINAQLALAFTKFFPGNLNAEEVRIAKQAASGDFSFSEKDYQTLLDIFARQNEQLAETQDMIDKTYEEFIATNDQLRKENKQILGQSELLARTKAAIRKVNKKYRKGSQKVNLTDLEARGQEGGDPISLIMPTDPVVLSSRALAGFTPTNRQQIGEQLRLQNKDRNYLLTTEGKDDVVDYLIGSVVNDPEFKQNLSEENMKKVLQNLLEGFEQNQIANITGDAGGYVLPTNASIAEVIKARLGGM